MEEVLEPLLKRMNEVVKDFNDATAAINDRAEKVDKVEAQLEVLQQGLQSTAEHGEFLGEEVDSLRGDIRALSESNGKVLGALAAFRDIA
jgi:prefoldin subunit 5